MEKTKQSLSNNRVAVVQAASVAFDGKRSLAKALDLIRDASKKGAALVLFPEAFLSGYPRGLDFGAVVGSRSQAGRDDFRRYWESAVDVPGPTIAALGKAARSNKVFLVMGAVERDRGTLNSPGIRHASRPGRRGDLLGKLHAPFANVHVLPRHRDLLRTHS